MTSISNLSLPELSRPKDEAIPSLVLHRFISGYWISGALYVVAKLGIADLLKDGPKTCAELAASTLARVEPLRRIMRALGSVRIFQELGDDRYALTPMSALLVADAPGSLRAWTILQGQEWRWKVWGQFPHAVESGETLFEEIHGMPFFEFLDQHRDARELYDEALVGLDALSTSHITTTYDFSQFVTIVDVGGGLGAFLAQLLAAHPRMRGVLFDLPAVVERATDHLRQAGLIDRCQLVAGDFLRSIPSGGDAYVLKQVVHLLTKESAVQLLSNCRQAIGADGRLLIIEQVLSSERGASYGKFLDLDMMIIIGGCLRTVAEHEELLQAAGFRLRRSIPLPETCAYSLLEAVPH